MISLRGLGKRFGPKELFSNVSIELYPGQRYGLIGANGSGKTTFLKILVGDEPADDGAIVFASGTELGVLRQDRFLSDNERILDLAMAGDAPAFSALQALTRGDDLSPEKAGELEELLTARDGYTLEARAREVLVGLGIPSASLTNALGTLSGGYKLRVLLAQVLVGKPHALFLDEPTNHLDILSIRWLEGFLRNYEGAALVISHDRHFLDRITTRMLDVDYGTITEYPGNYTAFVSQKALASEQLEAQIARNERIIAEKRAFVERFGAKATKAKQAQSRLKQIEKIEVLERETTSRRAPLFHFKQARETGKDVLRAEELGKAYGERVVLDQVNLFVRRGERIGIIGENGVGKSTLLKILAGVLEADRGQFSWGANVKLGYFAQDHHDLLSNPKLTPLDYVYEGAPDETVSAVRGELGRMLISGDEVKKKVTVLSGGEAARLVFARIGIEKPNVLLLDEPTNHLDLESIDALAASLQAYEGTLLFVSHDRWFVSEVATRILEIRKDGITDFPGTFAEYLAKDGSDHLDGTAVSLKAKKELKDERLAERAQKADGAELSHEERKRRANRLKSLPKKRDELMAQIEQLEAKKAAVEARFLEPKYFELTPASEQAQHRSDRDLLGASIDAKIAEWEALEAELEELGRVASSV